MSRLIDADKLIKEVRKEPTDGMLTQEIVELINEQTSTEANQWILVKERLPEDYVNVLTCDKKGNMHIFSHCKGYEYPFCIPPNHTRYYMPVAWQPLPKACKEV